MARTQVDSLESAYLNLTPARAREIQYKLREQVILENQLGEVCLVAGVDAAYHETRGVTRAAAALIRLPGLELVAHVACEVETRFPYVPGLFAFREAPAVLKALAELSPSPDLILCDGHGLAHPRRCGLACHVGVLADIPTIGVAKTKLVGSHETVPAQKGTWVPLTDAGECVGAVVRTREAVKPVFVSVGHKVDLHSAVRHVLCCTGRYRLPEPLRWAHRLAASVAPGVCVKNDVYDQGQK